MKRFRLGTLRDTVITNDSTAVIATGSAYYAYYGSAYSRASWEGHDCEYE